MCNLLLSIIFLLMIVYYTHETESDSISHEHEDFDLPVGIITDKSLIDPSKKYQVGRLKPGVVSTVTEAVGGGKMCNPLPNVVYRPV